MSDFDGMVQECAEWGWAVHLTHDPEQPAGERWACQLSHPDAGVQEGGHPTHDAALCAAVQLISPA